MQKAVFYITKYGLLHSNLPCLELGMENCDMAACNRRQAMISASASCINKNMEKVSACDRRKLTGHLYRSI